MSKVKILFELDDNWHGSSSETVWAEQHFSGNYQILNSPFFVDGISYKDIVSAFENNGCLQFGRVISHEGHSTFRIIADLKIKEADILILLKDLNKLGCTYEEGPHFKGQENDLVVFAIDVEPKIDLNKVLSLLKDAEASSVCEYDEGFLYQKSDRS